MQTRIKDTPLGLSFQYLLSSSDRLEREARWRWVGNDANPYTWETEQQRDLARQCFTHRKSVHLALKDLAARGLSPKSESKGTK